MIAGLSVTGASNILWQDINPVDAMQCCLLRGQLCVAPEVDLRGNVQYICLCNANKAEPTLALKPRGDITRNPKRSKNRTCECVSDKKD